MLVTSTFLAAQNSQLRAYTIADGLPQSQVYAMAQDSIGYLWLGTQGGGLCNFNGSSFSIWNENDGLLSNYIHALHASNDSLFIGTARGLSIKTKHNFTNFKCPKINRFFKANNRLYLATKQGLYTYSKTKTLQKLKLHPELDASTVNALLFDGASYWIATKTALWKTKHLQNNANETLVKIDSNNFTALVLHENHIFAATFKDGILIRDLKATSTPLLLREPLRINAMSIHHKDELWVATDDNGITIIDTKNYTEKKILNTANGLAVPHVRFTFTDRQSNIWIGTSGGGFYKYFQNNFKHYDAASGLKGNRIYAVHHAKHNVWISSSETGLTRIDSLGIHHLPKVKQFSRAKIKTITSNAKGDLWAGSDGNGILYRTTRQVDSIYTDTSDSLHITTQVFSKLVTKNHVLNTDHGFPSDWIRKIVCTQDAVWAATYSSGIVKFNYNTVTDSLTIQRIYTKADGIADLSIKDLVLDPENRLWYATQTGHLGYIKNDTHTALGTVLEQQTAIGTLLFHQDKLYIGTAGQGIWVSEANPKTLQFKPLKGTKKIISKNIYQLIFDDQGYLWAGTERGVSKLQLNATQQIEDIYHFGRNDGFLGIETCLNAVDKDDKGQLWFGAIYGLTQYLPLLNNKTGLKPKVHFNDVQVAYKSIDTIALKAWTNSEKVLALTPKQTQLSFTYKSVDIDHPNQIEYRSKLNTNTWSPWSKTDQQNFAGLAYGAHVFTVQSRNHRWEESTPITFRFFIDSPLYQKAWFQWAIIGSVLFILLLLSLLYIRKIRLKNKAAQTQLKLKNHLLTLEHKALQLQMNPHFIFNVLNGIKAMAIHKPEHMNSTINSFATLLRETLHNSRKEHITLAQEVKTLRHYITVEQLMASKPFSFSIDTHCELDLEEILIPPMLIQPFVENAIRHGILKAQTKGVLTLTFSTSAQFLHCKVVDNGIGIFTSQHNKEKTDHQSMALTVTKERLISIAGKNTLVLKELKAKDGTINGTSITFSIPLLTDY